MDKVSHEKNRKFYERAKNRPLSGIGSCASEISVGGTKKMTFNLYDSGYSSVGCSQRILSIFTGDSSDLGTISTSKYFMNVQNVYQQ